MARGRKHATTRRSKRRAPPVPKALGWRVPPAVLADADWQTILDATGPLPKRGNLVQARRRLARCLRDYRGLRRDPAKLHAALRIWRRIDKLATPLHAAVTEEWQQNRWRYDRLLDTALKRLLTTAKTITESSAMRVRMRKGKRDPARNWLFLTLLDLWVYDFGGTLTASKTSSGGPGVRFLRTAAVLVLDARKVPSVVTARRIIRAVASGKSIGIFRVTKVR